MYKTGFRRVGRQKDIQIIFLPGAEQIMGNYYCIIKASRQKMEILFIESDLTHPIKMVFDKKRYQIFIRLCHSLAESKANLD